MTQSRILIVDDEAHVREILSAALSKLPHVEIDVAENGQEAAAFVKNHPYQLVLCDLMMPKTDGLAVLKLFQERGSLGSFILITAHGTIERAVEAIKLGAYDFLVKPVNLKQLELTIQKALESASLRQQNVRLRRELQEKNMGSIIGRSPRIQEVLSLADRVAKSDSTVLITGPSGTGKELIARRIHYLSPRATNSFVTVNCGAIPGNLLESQLFGYVRGAFTGAESDRNGLFQEADGGTLFLDEIGELDLNLQVKVLRAIQEHEVRPVGAMKEARVDIRLLAATNRQLMEEVKKGTFREDLYYRLNVVAIDLPPLCDRAEDIPELVYFFIKKYNPVLGKAITATAPAFLTALQSHTFPGNIRELENIVQKAMILADSAELSSITFSQLRPVPSLETKTPRELTGDLGLHDMVEALEKEVIVQALERFNANHSQVAKFLKIPRSTLYKKLHDYKIDTKKI